MTRTATRSSGGEREREREKEQVRHCVGEERFFFVSRSLTSETRGARMEMNES